MSIALLVIIGLVVVVVAIAWWFAGHR